MGTLDFALDFTGLTVLLRLDELMEDLRYGRDSEDEDTGESAQALSSLLPKSEC